MYTTSQLIAASHYERIHGNRFTACLLRDVHSMELTGKQGRVEERSLGTLPPARCMKKQKNVKKIKSICNNPPANAGDTGEKS